MDDVVEQVTLNPEETKNPASQLYYLGM